MNKPISPGLKILFLVHLVFAFIFGLVYLLIPEVFGGLFKLPTTEPFVTALRLLGAAIMAFGFGSWYAYRATAWDQVKIVVQMELVWTILGALVSLLAALFAGFAPVGWINFVILAGFAVAFWIFYSQHEIGQMAAAPVAPPSPRATPAARPARKAAPRRRRR
jgi:hypothetical protein